VRSLSIPGWGNITSALTGHKLHLNRTACRHTITTDNGGLSFVMLFIEEMADIVEQTRDNHPLGAVRRQRPDAASWPNRMNNAALAAAVNATAKVESIGAAIDARGP
jgi:hypothetical protein